MSFNIASKGSIDKKRFNKIIVMGRVMRWVRVAAMLLDREGFLYDVQPSWGRELLRWFFRGRWLRHKVIYHIGGTYKWFSGLLFFMTRRSVIWHWIGSDILFFRTCRGWQRIINRLSAYKWAKAHIADSPELAEELRKDGISASVVRLLPECINAEVKPLPQSFSVLSYWEKGRKEFYGGDIVLQLAREFPNVEFKITGTADEENPSIANVEFLGFQKNISDIYDNSTVLIRLPQHDSLSAMVLEMLARGRYVIYNKKLAGCHFAQNFGEAKDALTEIMRLNKPNIHGARFVKENFSIAEEAKKLAEIFIGAISEFDIKSQGENVKELRREEY